MFFVFYSKEEEKNEEDGKQLQNERIAVRVWRVENVMHGGYEWLHKRKYLLTSYVSTNAINPSGNAIANDTIAANSPSFDSSGETSNMPDNCCRYPIAISSKFRTEPLNKRERSSLILFYY